MSLETAMKTLEAAPQPQAITQQEKSAATSEAETKSNNGEQLTAQSTDKGVADAAPTPAKKEEPLSAKFAALTKKETAIVKRDQEIRSKEAAFADREAKIAEREARIKQSEELWDTDVFKALEARGYTYNKLTDLMLEGKTAQPESTDPVVLAKKTIDDFKKEQAKRDSDKAEADKKASEAAEAKQKADLEKAWEDYRNEIEEYIKSNETDYELIALYGQQALVADTVNEFYQKNKRVLSVKEASDLVENYLVDEAKKAMSTKKFGTTAPKVEAKSEPKAKESPKTLNNFMQPTSASTLPVQSDTDRMKRALAALSSNS